MNTDVLVKENTKANVKTESDTKMLDRTFKTVGNEYGYNDVSAEFVAFRELKIKWTRSMGKAEFKVSDYFKGSNENILESVARTLFSRITGEQNASEWSIPDDFVEKNQSTYIRRSKNLTRSPKGEFRNLEESCERLERMGLITHDKELHISWTREPNVRRVGYCSVLMKVIAISSVFDNDSIPEFVLDYVVYHEYVHLMTGYKPFGKKHGTEFKNEERKYPQQKEADAWLKRLCMYT